MVVDASGLGIQVVATVKSLVGHCGEAFLAVILEGGTGCIGAYRVGPV